jgi:hypothetical protein
MDGVVSSAVKFGQIVYLGMAIVAGRQAIVGAGGRDLV